MPLWSTSGPKTRSKTKSLRPWGESIDRLVLEVTCTMGRWKRCGIKSYPGSSGLNCGRTRTAAKERRSLSARTLIRHQTCAFISSREKKETRMHTDADSSPVVLVRGSALAALLAVHTQPTVAPWLRTSSNHAQGTLKLMRWRW